MDLFVCFELQVLTFYFFIFVSFSLFQVAVIVYNAVLVGVLLVVAPHTPLQLFLALLVCTAYMLLVLKAAPYITQNLDTLSFLCSVSLSSTMLIGVLKSTNDYVTGPEKGKEGIGNIPNGLLGLMLVGVNALPFIYLIFTVIQRQLIRRKETTVIKHERTPGKRNHRYSKATNIMPLGELNTLPDTPEQRPRTEQEKADFQAWD